MKFDFVKILCTICLISLLIIFIMFFQHVSIGDKISKDCCDGDKAEQYWNIGLFIAIMAGFWSFFDLFIENSYFGDYYNKEFFKKEDINEA